MRPAPAQGRRLRWFIAGQGINGLGTMISSVALPLVAVDRLHASTFMVGLLEAVQWIPALVIGLPVGAAMDRFQPRARTIMMSANLGQAAATAVVPATAAAGLLTLPVMLAAAGVAGFFTVFFQAGYTPYLRSLVAPADYVSATARVQATRSATRLTGPALAGALVQALGAAITLLSDAASFLVSFLSLAIARAPAITTPAQERPQQRLREDIRAGLAHLRSHRPLLTIALATAAANLFLTAIGAIEIPFLVRDVRASSTWIGILFALTGTGSLIGSLLLTRISKRFGLTTIARAAIATTAPAALLIPLTHHGLAMVFFALAGPPTSFGIALASTSFISLRLQWTPAELQARISTTSQTLTAATIPTGALLGGALGQLIGNRTALLALALGYLAFGLRLLRSPNLHATTTPPHPNTSPAETGLDHEPTVNSAPVTTPPVD